VRDVLDVLSAMHDANPAALKEAVAQLPNSRVKLFS
jgi:hypothetical protein